MFQIGDLKEKAVMEIASTHTSAASGEPIHTRVRDFKDNISLDFEQYIPQESVGSLAGIIKVKESAFDEK